MGRTFGEFPVADRQLRLGLTWWGRLHGLVSLELGGHLRATGVDPQLLYQSEIHSLLEHLEHTD